MGDTSINNHETIADPVPKSNPKCDELKSSISLLREAKPSENITAPSSISQESKPSLSTTILEESSDVSMPILKKHPEKHSEKTEAKESSPQSPKIETVFESDIKSESSALESTIKKKPSEIIKKKENKPLETTKLKGTSATNAVETREKINRNQSDIFSLRGLPTAASIATTIFSVSGAPSRKIYRKNDLPPPSGNMGDKNSVPKLNDSDTGKLGSPSENLGDSTERIRRPVTAFRNPLTGTGVTSNDEYRYKICKKRDGNPVLGVGYSSELPTNPSSSRIPPGGYSKGLW